VFFHDCFNMLIMELHISGLYKHMKHGFSLMTTENDTSQPFYIALSKIMTLPPNQYCRMPSVMPEHIFLNTRLLPLGIPACLSKTQAHPSLAQQELHLPGTPYAYVLGDPQFLVAIS